jgi:hypothetical protein
MEAERIEFISEYCDRWCERCAFTNRCSTYAVNVATAMCGGDFEAGLELAVGAPPPHDEAERKRREEFLEQLANWEPTKQEIADIEREQRERDERVDESPITTMATIASMLAHRWLDAHGERVMANADPCIAEAIEVAGWDCHFISAKLHRALEGRDEADRDEDREDPVQNDWNGSAKVALISIERSAIAWDIVAQATNDADAATIAEQLRNLGQHVRTAFPNAWSFIRPGFDESE